jgi:AraC family transcriptional regulator
MSPPEVVTRRVVVSDGIALEIVEVTSHDRFEFTLRAPVHTLVVYEQGARRDGETSVEGLSRSTLRDYAGKLTFVPAGRLYREWQEPRTLARFMHIYFDPSRLRVMSNTDVKDGTLGARLFFEDAMLLDTALRVKRSIEGRTSENRPYLEALGVLLVHDLIRCSRGEPRQEPQLRGGLAGWQQRIATAYIDAHLCEPIALATLARLVRLSPFYFCRAFKQSLGLPPHRYHTHRRMEHAKTLLATWEYSVTDIGLTVGYSETSSFTTAFRRATGLTPSAYQRSLA